MEKYILGSVKEFITLTKENYSTEIKTFYEKKRLYHIDGLIFTPGGIHFKEVLKKQKANGGKRTRVFNTDYSSTISFKWKPLDQLTIDFYLMSHPAKKGYYVLCSGVDSRTFELLQLEFFDGYKAPESPNSHQYFPIQFNPSDGKFDYVWKPDECSEDETDLSGLVAEFAFAEGGKLLDRPKMIRLRLDRVHDVALGQYYGNALRYAELIWHSIQHPLTIDAMRTTSSLSYFAADDTDDWYKPQRSFNSFVKTYLMETYLYSTITGKARIMDIAAGKGQDTARAIDVGYDEIVALDRDVDALYEMLERKHNLRVRRKGATANIHIKQIDLEDTAVENIAKLKIPGESADSAMISHAIHYICHAAVPGKQDPLDEFAKLCGYYLKKGGRLMVLTFNGKDIFELLQNREEWSVKDDGRIKYSIKKAYSSDALTNTDQGIDVLLPFSNGGYYREYLVNYEHVESTFAKHGFKVIKTDSFGSLLRTYKKQNGRGYASLSVSDREYVALYGFMILEKK